jgi:hypothetical protein
VQKQATKRPPSLIPRDAPPMCGTLSAMWSVHVPPVDGQLAAPETQTRSTPSCGPFDMPSSAMQNVGVSNTGNDGRASSPIEVPEDILERVSTLCLALPEVTVRVDVSLTRTRSTAHSFDIRRRSFCLLVARYGLTGKPVPLLVLRADPDERDALLSIGHPFYASRAGLDRVGVWLTDDTDWEEIRELVTESYRRLAPKKLIALLD